MTTQPEAHIVRAILAALNELPHTYARKTHGSRYSVGWPDIIGSHRGRMLAIEVKQPGKRASARQAHELRRWELAGAIAGVACSVDEALALVQGARRRHDDESAAKSWARAAIDVALGPLA